MIDVDCGGGPNTECLESSRQVTVEQEKAGWVIRTNRRLGHSGLGCGIL